LRSGTGLYLLPDPQLPQKNNTDLNVRTNSAQFVEEKEQE
jgi:hypothetical protein